MFAVLFPSIAMGVVVGETVNSPLDMSYVGFAGIGTAVGVAPNYFLTAQHFNSGATVTMEGVDYPIIEIIDSPAQYGANPDLRLLRTTDLPGWYKPNPNELAHGDDLVMIGTGYSGYYDESDGGYYLDMATGRAKRWGTNQHRTTYWLDGSDHSQYAIHADCIMGQTPNEATFTFGDSGAGVFVGDRLAGIAISANEWAWNAVAISYYYQWIIQTAYPEGDMNLDGMVNATDLAILSQGFGQVAGYESGDANFSGVVDAADLAVLKSGLTFQSSGAAVPEPATMGLLAVGTCLPLLRKRE